MRSITTILIALLSLSAFAQTGTLKGVVRDKFSNEPLAFVNIVIQGTTKGGATDIDGSFEITGINPGFIIVQTSILGYKPFSSDEIRVTTSTHAYVEIKLEETSTTLGEVVVQADKFTQKLETPLSLHRIGVEDIEKSAGANRDISKVIQTLPGVGSTASFRNDLIVRGGGPSENKFYLEGIEIPTINHFSTQGSSGGPTGILNVDFIKSADYYSSAFPATKGNALSSIFDFRLIDGNKDKPSFRASVGASEISFSANTPVGEESSLLFSVRRSYLQFLFSQLGLPFLPTFNDMTLRYKTKLNSKNELSILAIGAYDQFTLNMNADSTDESNRYILGYLPINNQWNYTVGATHKLFLGNSVLTTVISRNHLNNDIYKYKNNIETDPSNLLTDYNSNEIENKFRSEFNTTTGDYNLIAGVLAEYAFYDNYNYFNQYVNGTPVSFNTSSELSIVKYGIFGSASRTLADRLTLTAGLRFDGNNYSDDMRNMFKQISPRLAASYKLSDPISINANIGRYNQLPSYTMLGHRDEAGNLVNKANNIKYITVNHYVAGVELRPNRNSKITIEGFYKQYGDYPFSVTDSVSMASKGGDFGVFGDEAVTPTSKGNAKGVEFLYRISTDSKFRVMASYTFVRSNFTNGYNSYIPSSWDNRNLFTTTIGKSFKKNWDIGIKWRYVGGLPYTPYDVVKSSYVQAWDIQGRGYLDYGKFNTLRLASFHQLDLRVDKSFYFDHFMIGLYVDIQNAYNQQSAGAPQLVQNLDANNNPIILNPTAPIAEQRYDLKELSTTSGTVLPTIGIIIEF